MKEHSVNFKLVNIVWYRKEKSYWQTDTSILSNVAKKWFKSVENHSQDHEKLSFHTYMELVYVNIRTCIQACFVHWTSLCKY